MNPVPTPHDDALDELIVAALHDELTPEERAAFDARLSNDPAARAAYQEAHAMHDLLEKTHAAAQPEPDFEQRMVSGVRRKLKTEPKQETAWESCTFFYRFARRRLTSKWTAWEYGSVASALAVMLTMSYVLQHDFRVLRALGESGISNPAPVARRLYLPDSFYAQVLGVGDKEARHKTLNEESDLRAVIDKQGIDYVETAQRGITLSGTVDTNYTQQFAGEGATFANVIRPTLNGANIYTGGAPLARGNLVASARLITPAATPQLTPTPMTSPMAAPAATTPPASPDVSSTSPPAKPFDFAALDALNRMDKKESQNQAVAMNSPKSLTAGPLRLDYGNPYHGPTNGDFKPDHGYSFDANPNEFDVNGVKVALENTAAGQEKSSQYGATAGNPNWKAPTQTQAPTAPAIDTRKLIRNAQLDLEVKSYQAATDAISALTKDAGGYVDTSHSQRGGNGKLQGTVVVKVLPQNLDAFLLKLRDLGELTNQSVSTDDVTKDYFDTTARLENSRRMETQLQDLLKRENGKVSDLLAVERELARVRGEIEQMQGQLKLYDFQVQYATVTINLREKDLNQAAAYLLKEQDDFSLYATDVEASFQQARHAADTFKAQVLQANLNHNSGSNVSAELVVLVAPEQIEPFLDQVRALGRVANFTRQTQRVAQDGGDSDQPADQTLTERDNVQVHVAIRSDDESRKQVALTVVAKAVDDALDQAKSAALAHDGVEILSSSLNKAPQGQSTAQLSVRVPGKDYAAVMEAFKALGRTASLSIQRNDDSGPGASGDDGPVIVALSLTDDDTAMQQTQMTVRADDVDAGERQIKKDAAAAGVEVKASSFEREPDGTESAQMTFRLPMGKYAAFLESVKALGKVESLTVRRDDRPDQAVSDDAAPADIQLQLHNERDLVAANDGLFATLRQTFGEGAAALFGSIRVIGVLVAFALPWVVAGVTVAWGARRVYVWRRNRSA